MSRIISATRCIVTSGFAAAALSAAPISASATTLERLQQAALGVEGYYQTVDRCYYADAIAPVMDKVDAFHQQQYGNLWLTIRERVAPTFEMSVNHERTFFPDTSPPGDAHICRNVSLNISFVLAGAMSIVGPNPEVLAEMSRLADGKGQVR